MGILIQSGFSNKSHSQAMHDFPGVNFTKILQAVFVHKDSKKHKKTMGGNSQNFLCKFVRFFLTLKCFYRVVINKKIGA